jgi:hypothetical protein
VDVTINLHQSSEECEALSSFKDFMDTATTASGAGAAAFTEFLALAFFLLCLMAIIFTGWRIQKLVLPHGGGQGQLSSFEPVLDPHCGCLVMPLVAMVLAFMEGGDLMGAHHFNWAFMIPFLKGSLPIMLYRSTRQYQLLDLAVSSISSLPQNLLSAGTLCALGQKIIQDVSGLSNLTGWHFHPVQRLHMKFTSKMVVYYFMIAQMSLILLQIEFGLTGVLQE